MTTPLPQRPPQHHPFETRPLTEPVDPRAVNEFWRVVKAQNPSSGAQVAFTVVIAAIFALVFLPTVGMILIGTATSIASGEAGFGALFSLPALILLVIAGVGIPLFVVSRRRTRESTYRIARFAEANGMTFRPFVSDPPLPGMIFHLGHSRMASQLVRGQEPRFVEFGNYRYTTGSGKNKTTHNWGYVAVKLDVPLPNIVLDALGNNALGSNLPATFSKDQRLSLEGDFDRYFTLYCPQGYEADALYLFTPDIMARFIDHAAQLDVEIVDDWMFLYMRRPASTTDARTWAWLFGTVGALMTKFDQWARWRDDRLRLAQGAGAHPSAPPPAAPHAGAPVAPPLPFAPPLGMLTPPPPGVAPQGRRLRKGFSWVTLVIILVVFGITLVPQLIGFLSFFLTR
ncbi:hypothetical protein FVO59_05505 [Microbacterium esteraromaticum]|uniref:DUF3137 domain-containing protein n=1 Tax=Microbacterium esteraromaticum TaxID=57043 RepID=A0A7D7WG92_9MICO|nr:hypothetical protein [Microbacterium esteraromaticum]QMU96734.1 hypothetical protein FVO59_05505 [Microbacterium esteraromaticum]